jgi:hypothetical protein
MYFLHEGGNATAQRPRRERDTFVDMPVIPQDVIDFLFNVNQGTHIDMYCSNERKITDQVVISYSQLWLFKHHEIERVFGRVFDIIPGVRFFIGKPTLCRCGTINR